MSFSQAAITQVNPPIVRAGELHLSWISTAPAGTWFQVYFNRVLAWHGRSQYAAFPVPPSLSRIDVGTVGPGEATADFSAVLPSAPEPRVKLAWEGGASLDPSGQGDVAGFYIYQSAGPAGYGSGGYDMGGYGIGVATPDFTKPVANIPCYVGPGNTAGYGMGGYGAGGYGFAGAKYSWKSGPLWSGTWAFAVAAHNLAGDVGAAWTEQVSIHVPPRPPGGSQAPPRMTYVIAAGPRAILTWLPSPG